MSPFTRSWGRLSLATIPTELTAQLGCVGYMFSKDPGVESSEKERLKNDMIGIVNQDQLHHPIQSKHLAPWTWTQNI